MSIQDEFLFVRRVFFPYWRRGKQWTVEEVERFEDETTAGRCLRDKQTIQIMNQEHFFLREILIHEVCHAVTARRGVCHSPSWHTRMEKAAQKAETNGDRALAESLREDAARYLDSNGFDETPLSDDIISGVEEVVRQWPDLTFDQVKEIVGNKYGIPSPFFDLPCNVKRYRREFDRAKKDVRDERKIRAQFDAALAAQGSK